MEIKTKQVPSVSQNHCSVVGGGEIRANPKVPSGGSYTRWITWYFQQCLQFLGRESWKVRLPAFHLQ